MRPYVENLVPSREVPVELCVPLNRNLARLATRRPVEYNIRIVTTTADTVLDTDDYLVGNNVSGITETLPAAGGNIGRLFMFKNKGAGTMTLSATNSGQIFSTALVNTLALATGEMVSLTSDGTTWLVGN